MKKLLTFLTLLTLSIGVGWAATATWPGTTALPGSATYVGSDTHIKIMVSATNTYTNPIRVYANTTITITADDGYVINSVTYEASSTGNYVTYAQNATVSPEVTPTVSGKNVTWSYGNNSTVTEFTFKPSSQTRCNSITINYSASGSSEPDPTAPSGTITFNPAAGEVASGTTVLMTFSGTCTGIKYTTDGTSPNATNGTVYDSSNPPVITGATTIKAAAYNYSNSKYAFGTEATASYTIAALPDVDYDGSATFVAGTDLGSTTANNSKDEMTKSPVTVSSDDAAFGRTDNYRLYAGSTTEFSVPTGYKIVKIEFTPVNGYSTNLLSTTTGTYSGGTWIGEAESVSFSASAQFRCTQIQVYYTAPASTGPEYYLVGTFNNWTQNADYKFFENNGTFTLDNVSLPANSQFKIIKVDNGTTWYGGTGEVVYNIHHTHHTGLPMNGNVGSQNYTVQSAGVTSFSFTVNDNTPSNLNVNREAKLYIKGGFNSWQEEAMVPTANGWTTTQTVATNNKFGFVDEFGQYRGREWTIYDEHIGQAIPMGTNGDYLMGIAGSFIMDVPSDLSTLTLTRLAEGDLYSLITSTDDLEVNHEYIVVGKTATATYVMSKTLDGGRATRVSVTPDASGRIAATNDMAIITLDGNSTDGWTLSTSEGYVASGGNGKMQFSSSAVTASIGFGAGDDTEAALIDFNNNTSYPRLKHNTSSQWFACYATTSGTANVYLYKKLSASNKSAAPVITPESGNIVGFSQEVEITQSNSGNIYYTIDGTTPDENSTPYNGKFWVEGSLGDVVTVIAVAKETGKELSNTVTVNYRFVAPAAPVFTPGAGTYTTPQTVTVSTTTEGADVYYTATANLSAAQIVAQGTKFEAPFTVSEATTYYAVTVYHDAHANRDALSGIRQAQYKFSEVESVDLPYSRPFTDSEGFGDEEFTIQNVENPDDITVWTVSTQYGAKGTSYVNGTNYAATSWLLSPYINLGDAEEPVLTFDHQINKYFANPSEQATVWIKTYGGEWTQLATSLPENSEGITGWPKYNEEYDLTNYKGQIIQIGFKYDNPTAGSGAGTWEIQNFLVTDNAPIEVENIAEYLALPIGTNNITFKNPVTVQYHYISDRGKSYIYVKDDSGCAYFHQPAVDGETAIAQLANGDIIAGGFSGNKVPDEMVGEGESNFAMFTDLENFAANGDKGLADPEHETVAHIADATTGVALNNHYITIKKVKLSALYQPTDITYGDAKYFDIDNVAHIGYNKFNIDYSVVDDLNAYYNITGIQTAYNNVMEFHPTEIVKWEEAVVTLRELCDKGVTTEGENEYTISNNVLGVFAKDNRLWVKDDTGQSIRLTSQPETEESYYIDAEGNTREEQAYYDQSNWLEVILPSTTSNPTSAKGFEDHIINGGQLTGKFTNKVNPTLEVTSLPDAGAASSYEPNYYCVANFMDWTAGANHLSQVGDDGKTYFFMNPKPQEYAVITWAMWKDGKFVIPADGTIVDNNGRNHAVNNHNFNGAFEADWSLNANDDQTEALNLPGNANGMYEFHAIIRMKDSTSNGAPRNAVSPKGDQTASSNYVVSPTDLNVSEGSPSIITAVNDVKAAGEVLSVTYYNVAGVQSSKPFDGINIVVTRYTDGTASTAKVVR